MLSITVNAKQLTLDKDMRFIKMRMLSRAQKPSLASENFPSSDVPMDGSILCVH
jgi:hypothetical protein